MILVEGVALLIDQWIAGRGSGIIIMTACGSESRLHQEFERVVEAGGIGPAFRGIGQSRDVLAVQFEMH